MRQTLAFVPLSPRASRTEPPLRLPHSTGCCYDPLSLSPHSLRQPSFPLVPGSYGEAVAAPRPARTPRSRGPAPGSVRRPLVAGGASSLLLAPAPPLGIIDGDVSARRGCHYHSVPASSKASSSRPLYPTPPLSLSHGILSSLHRSMAWR
jgi:hypothetical protein